MKKFIALLILAFLIGGVLRIVGVSATVRNPDYTMHVRISEINDGIVHFVDDSGNEWLYECENVVLHMNDNGTPDIYDDIIERVDF